MEVETKEAERQHRLARRWVHGGRAVFDADDRLAATARSPEEARRVAAALNLVEGMPTDALEAWTTGVICDPVNDLAAQLESILILEPLANERRRADRRQGERRRFLTEVRVESGR